MATGCSLQAAFARSRRKREKGHAPAHLPITPRNDVEPRVAGCRDITALLEAGVLTRAADGKIEFPFDAVKVEFLLHAA